MIDLDDELTEARATMAALDSRADVDADLAAVHARSHRSRRRRATVGTGVAAIVVLVLVASVAVARRPSAARFDVGTAPSTTEDATSTTVTTAPTTVTTEAATTVPSTVVPTIAVPPPSTTVPPMTTTSTSAPTTTSPTPTIARRSPPTSSHPDPLPGVPAGVEAYAAWKANLPARYTYRSIDYGEGMWGPVVDTTVQTVDGHEQVVAAVYADTGLPVNNPSAAETISQLYQHVFEYDRPNRSSAMVATGQPVEGVPSAIDVVNESVQFRIEISGFWLE